MVEGQSSSSLPDVKKVLFSVFMIPVRIVIKDERMRPCCTRREHTVHPRREWLVRDHYRG